MRLLYLFSLALVIRFLAFSFLIYDLPASHWQEKILHANQDSLEYQRLALSLKEGKGYSNERGEPTAYRPPLYATFICLIYTVTQSENPLWVIFAQILLSSLAVILMERIGGILFTKDIGFFAALLLCVNPHLSYFSCQLLSETLFQFLFLLTLLFMFQPGLGSAAVTGLIAALCALCRTVGIIFLPLSLFFLILKPNERQKSKKALLILTLFLLTLAPWTYRNWRVGGNHVLISTNGGKNMLRGLNEKWLQSIHESGVSFDDSVFDSAPEWQREKAQYALARSIILQNPGYFLRVTLAKWLHFFSPLPSSDYPMWFRLLSLAYVGPLFVLGFWGLSKKHDHYSIYFFSLIFLFSLIHAFYFTNIRFRVPIVDSALVIFSARTLFDFFPSKVLISPNPQP